MLGEIALFCLMACVPALGGVVGYMIYKATKN